MKTFLRSFLLIFTITLLTASAACALPKILILGAEQSPWIADIQTNLTNTGQFAQVDYQVVPSGPSGVLPTLSQLQGYGSVMVFGDYGMGAGLGTVLAQYADGGGGVVVATFCTCVTQIDASFNNATYNVMNPSGEATGTVTLGTVVLPSHPIMSGVSSVNGGSSSYRGTSSSLAGTAYIIAKWSDGTILVAARENVGANSKARRVDVNMFPVSSTIRSDFWQTSTNGGILLANAMTWAAGASAPPSELNLQPRSVNFGTAPPGSPVTYCVTANSIGAANLHITGISLAGPSDFTLLPGGKQVGDSILAGNSSQYCIQFNPTASGTRTGTFTLTTDGRDSGTQIVTLTGNGQVPSVSYSTNSMFRGVDVEVTDTSKVQYLYVNSTGVAALTVKGVLFYGLDLNDYFVTHLPASPIPPGGVDSIGVRFVPLLEGLPDAHMVVTSNASNIPSDTVGLYGVGILPHLTLSSPLPNVISNTNHQMVVTFDSVNLGTDSCLSVTVSNPGSDTLAIEKNSFSSADFDFALTPLTGRDTLIPPGGSQSIQVCFAPLQQGYRTATLRLYTNIPHTIGISQSQPAQDTSEFDVEFIGTGVPHGTPILRAVGGPVNDTIPVGTQVCVIDTFKNIGDGILTIDSIHNLVSSVCTFTFPAFPIVIPPNSNQTFTLCATLTDTGAFNGECYPVGCASLLVYTKEISNWTVLGTSFYGTKIGDTAIVAQAFPGACGTDTEQVLVMNTENVPEAYTASISGTNAADFTVLPPTTSQVESAGGVATFNVIFNPSTNATETANLNITGGISQTVPLSARGGTAAITGSGTAPMTFLGRTSAPFPVVVDNTGTCPWTTGTTITVDPQFTYVSGAGTISPLQSGTLMFTYTPTSETPGTYPVTFPSSTEASSINVTITTATDAVNTITASNGYSLGQNYPNPFSGTSDLAITLPTGSLVNLSIIDVQGQVVQTVLNQHYDAGTYNVSFKADGLSSGTYYYQMTAGSVKLTRQMVILK